MLSKAKHHFLRLRKTFEHLLQDDGLQLAAAVSYSAALSFFPLLLILTSGFGVILRSTGWGQDAQQQVLKFVSEQASPSLADRVEVALNEVQNNASFGGPVGLVSLLFAAMLIFAQFESAFDRIWNVTSKQGRGILSVVADVLWHRLRAFLMLVGVGLLMLATFVGGMALTGFLSASEEVVETPQRLWSGLQVSVTLIFNWGMFTLIYRLLPKVPVKWSEAAQGGLLASIVWEIGRQVLAALVIGNKYGAYGVIGAFIAILLWVYYGILVIFLGAEYVQVVCEECKQSQAESATESGQA